MSMPGNQAVDFINAPTDQTETYYADIIGQYWGPSAKQAYEQYDQNNQPNSPYKNAQAFVTIVAAQGLQAALDAAGQGVGTAQNQVITGTATGATNVVKNSPITKAVDAVKSITSWTEGLGKLLANILSVHFWIRAGEIVLGLFLIIWGAALFMRKEVGSTVGKGLGKVVPLL